MQGHENAQKMPEEAKKAEMRKEEEENAQHLREDVRVLLMIVEYLVVISSSVCESLFHT